MQTQPSNKLHPLMWIVGISLIVFFGAGVAAMMGWLPTSLGKPDDAVLSPSPRAAAPAVVKARPASNAPAPAAVVVTTKCLECGVVQSIREIETKGEGTGLGAVGGAVAGGLLGSQIGGGDGKKVMAVVGAVGGAVAGNEIEKRVKSAKSYEITVRFDDGSSRVISQAQAPAWRAGDKIKVINGVIQSNA